MDDGNIAVSVGKRGFAKVGGGTSRRERNSNLTGQSLQSVWQQQ